MALWNTNKSADANDIPRHNQVNNGFNVKGNKIGHNPNRHIYTP